MIHNSGKKENTSCKKQKVGSRVLTQRRTATKAATLVLDHSVNLNIQKPLPVVRQSLLQESFEQNCNITGWNIAREAAYLCPR
jgi:hypothetical protein